MPGIGTRKGKSGYGPMIADTVLAMHEYVAESGNKVRKISQRARHCIWKTGNRSAAISESL